MKKGLLTAGLAVTLIGGGIAGTTAFAASDSQNDDMSQEQLKQAASITKEKAISISLEEVPGEAVNTELDDEDGQPVYEVDIKGDNGKMWDLEVNAKSGDVLQKDADDEDGDDELSDQEEQKQLKKEADITKKESESIALEEVNGEVIGNELDDEDGAVVYSVEIKDDHGTEHEVEVDAKSGDVVTTEKDDEDEDGEDDDDEEEDEEDDD